MGEGPQQQATPAREAGVFASALGYPRLIAHRGGGSSAPENTLAAIRTGHAAGFRGVEFDAMLSADGTPFLIHDDHLERTTNGRGPVAAASDGLLQSLDAGAWHSAPFRGEPLPTLAAALALCRELGLWVNLEIKPSPGREAETGAAVARTALASGLAAPQLVLSSFSTDALAAARDAAPGLPRAWLTAAIPADWQRRLEALEARALHCRHSGLERQQAAAVLQAGYALACYTVNQRARLEALLAWGVTALFTDRLDLLAAAP